MFVDFNRVFNNGPQTELKIPEAMLKYLNSKLPEGIRYKVDDQGDCTIVSDNEPIKIGGFVFEPTEEQKKVLGERYTRDEIFNYCYNSQKPIPIKLKKEGFIVINDKEMPIEKMKYNPLKPVSFTFEKFYMYPNKFTEEHVFSVGCEGYSRDLLFRRVPDESVDTVVLESDRNQPLFARLQIKGKSKELSFTISYDLTYATTVRDIVESTSIYNAYVEGKGLLLNKPLTANISSSSFKKYNTDSINFWRKVLELEDVLNITFMPHSEEIDYSVLSVVEALYQNIIKGEPVRINKKIEKINGEGILENKEKVLETIGKPIFFEYKAVSNISLLGAKFDLPCVIGIFNSCLSDYIEKDEGYTVELKDKSEDEKMYISEHRFLDENTLQQYMSNDMHIDELRDAKDIMFYLEK